MENEGSGKWFTNICSIGQMCSKVIEHTSLAQPKMENDLWAYNIVSVANHR